MNSNGIQYFPVDVDIYDDPKVIPALCEFGEDAERVLFRLLSILYREGYCMEYNDAMKFSLSMKTRKDPAYIDGVVKSLVKYGFFEESLFEQDKILTSAGIQRRWVQATRKRTRKGFEYKYWLIERLDSIPEETANSGSKADEIEKQAEALHKQAEDRRMPTAQNGQSKVKESKEKKSIEQKKEDIVKLQTEFYNSLKPFVNSYTKEMLRKFYDYWSEPNKSFTKLRWQLEKTWDLNLRLIRWASNDKSIRTEPVQQTAKPLKELP